MATKATRAQVGFRSVVMATAVLCHKKKTDAKWSWKIVTITPVSGHKKASSFLFFFPTTQLLGPLALEKGVRIQ